MPNRADNSRKGIILAGGAGTRLYPLTVSVSKQLLPVYDKPLIYYPLATLMLAGIREILIITTPEDQVAFQRLLGDGTALGLRIVYDVQPQPKGLAEAFLIGEQFLAGASCALVLGDNLFFGHGLQPLLQSMMKQADGATIVTHPVTNPSRYGVVRCDSQGNPIEIEEKPQKPKSNWAVTGLYFFDPQVVSFAQTLQPSHRNELEITDLLRCYLQLGKLRVEALGRGFMWLDAGTEASLLQAANFVETVQVRQGLRICCVEEVAYRMKFIDREQLLRLSSRYANPYGDYLSEIANEV